MSHSADLTAAFIDYIRYERRLSAATLESYQRDLRQFTRWLQQSHTSQSQIPWSKIHQHQVRAWIASRHR
ncbi:MAG TPA: tyrosine recombinase XerC, partial [Gammaproteobacteria bacterium]|nr:tyrosine recombinase XerC [Gammaproteobacteria bacterium]